MAGARHGLFGLSREKLVNAQPVAEAAVLASRH